MAEIVRDKNIILKFANDLSDQLEVLKKTKTATLLLFSGGSAFLPLEHLNEKVFGPFLTIGMLDERFARDEQVNNFLQYKKLSIYQKAIANDVAHIDSSVGLEKNLDEYAISFENKIKKWRSSNPQGKIIITQGVGKDGHTAGIMPFPEDGDMFNNLFEGENLAVGYDAKNKNQFPLRMTVTNTFLRTVDISFDLILGEDKKEILKRIIENNEPLNVFPAGIVHEMRGVKIYTDIDI